MIQKKQLLLIRNLRCINKLDQKCFIVLQISSFFYGFKNEFFALAMERFV